MQRAASLGLSCMIVLLAALSPAYAAPWMHLSCLPAFPDVIENPGGEAVLTINLSLVDPASGMLDISLIDPGGTLVYHDARAGAARMECQWTVPPGSPDGLYRWDVQYTSDDYTGTDHVSFMATGRSTGICGFKIIDRDANGQYTPGVDSLAADWEICVHGLGGAPDLGCRSTESEYGSACWFFITPGTYEVSETLQPGYTPVASPVDTVTVTSGVIVEVDFFNAPLGGCCFYPTGDCEELTKVQCEAWGGTYQGDFVICSVGLCPSTPTVPRTWGCVKQMYR